ncbi:MAG: efflux transporter outer membrane subunit [Prevotella ruminicola]|uniref:Efflux transporter outer membrane subunit n=1 Tax=Xylanibacter ruminicola TaxID=839 RepID=A0A9D5P0L6_XYLRU|nr:efflux transporter outer membrane subunit [Xylanibacter ruminicola]
MRLRNNMKKIMIMMSAAVLLSSCGLYNKYERPDVDTKGLVRDTQSLTDTLAVQDTTSFGNLPWRTVFTDPQLQALIQQGLDNNPDLLNAALNVKMVNEALKIAKLAFLPSVALSPQGTLTSFDGAAATKAYQLPVSASWNVDLFGNLLSAKRSAQMQLIATKDYQTVVKTNIISGIANLYYTLLMIDRQLEIVTDMEQLTKETWEKMQFMHENRAGYRSTAVQSAEAAYYQVQAQHVDLQRQMREAENSLSLLLGQPGQAIPRGKFAEQNLPAEFATGVGIQMLANRADVHANEMALAQCFYDVETARSRFYPNITITGTAAFTNNNGMVNPGKWLLSAVGSLVQPIFQHGQIVAGLKVAKMQYEQAYNTWQNSIYKAGNEVSNALVAYNSYSQKAELDGKRVAVLQKNVEDTKRLMESSSNTTYLEVITAQSNLLNAEISEVADQLSKMQAVVSLYQALGGGAK